MGNINHRFFRCAGSHFQDGDLRDRVPAPDQTSADNQQGYVSRNRYAAAGHLHFVALLPGLLFPEEVPALSILLPRNSP